MNKRSSGQGNKTTNLERQDLDLILLSTWEREGKQEKSQLFFHFKPNRRICERGDFRHSSKIKSSNPTDNYDGERNSHSDNERVHFWDGVIDSPLQEADPRDGPKGEKRVESAGGRDEAGQHQDQTHNAVSSYSWGDGGKQQRCESATRDLVHG